MEFISAIESVCHKLLDWHVQELRAETHCLLRKAKPLKSNITKEESKALRELREDKDRMVLTASRSIHTDPTNKLKAKLILTLKRITRETNMGECMYSAMYPTSCTAPRFYGLPKIHITATSIRPIVSSRGSVSYGVAKVMNKVLKPLVGKSPHHIQSTSDSVSKVRDVTLLPGSV